MEKRLENANKLFEKLKKDMPDQLNKFLNFSNSVKLSDAIDNKVKELILVALGVNSQCDWCIAIHIQNAVKAGATKEEILEAAMLAVLMGGGPKLMYLNVVYEELEKYFP